jgi:hypothetical protein
MILPKYPQAGIPGDGHVAPGGVEVATEDVEKGGLS